MLIEFLVVKGNAKILKVLKETGGNERMRHCSGFVTKNEASRC